MIDGGRRATAYDVVVPPDNWSATPEVAILTIWGRASTRKAAEQPDSGRGLPASGG